MKGVKIKRPFATHYFTDAQAPATAYAHQGTCKTEENAKVATGVRIIRHQYAKAMVYDRRTGVLLWTYRRTASGISEHYGSGVSADQLRRVWRIK